MKHIELTNHIRGSILKQQYLEAFLVQGAYIESLLKLHADFSFFVETNKIKDSEIINELRTEVSNYSLYKLIEFLNKTKLIKGTLAQDLHHFRAKRNKVVHDLLTEIYDDSFEEDLKEICALGEAIVTSEEFKSILSIVEYQDETNKKITASTSSSVNPNDQKLPK